MPDDRRDFLKQGLVAAAGFAALPLAAASEPNQKVPLTQPITVNIVENHETNDGDRAETRSKLDLVGGNGAIHRITGYSMKIEREGSYDITVVLKTDKFFSSNDPTPADSDLRLMIVSGDKGAVEGDYRTDQIETTIFSPEGVSKTNPQIIKKSIVDPYIGLPLDQKVQAIFDGRMKSPRSDSGPLA